MRLPILVLLSTISVTYAVTAPNIKLPKLTRCGNLKEKYFECHVEASCLYGERQRETPMFLRRYYEKFHGKKNLTDCLSVVVVRASPAAMIESSERKTYEDKEIRRFEADGWIHPDHYKIGVRFTVGQKIVMLSEDDGFSDDDHWIYGSKDMYPVFNGTFKPVKSSTGAIHFTLTAQAHNGPRWRYYKEQYVPRHTGYGGYCNDNRPQPPTSTESTAAAQSNTSSPSDSLPSAGGAGAPATAGQQQQAAAAPAASAAAAANGTDAAAAQQSSASKSEEQAQQPATGGLPMFVIVIAIIAALVCVVAVAAGGYYYVRRRRASKQPKTEATQSETASLIGKDEGEKPASAAPSTTTAVAAPSSSKEEAK